MILAAYKVVYTRLWYVIGELYLRIEIWLLVIKISIEEADLLVVRIRLYSLPM